MKKKSLIIAVVAIVAIVSIFAVACTKEDETEQKFVEYKIIMPDGAPTLAAGELINNPELKDVNAKFTSEIVLPATIGQTLVKKEADFAIMPSNMASVIYNKTQDIKVIATVTTGNLYILGNGKTKLDNMTSLVGKKVYSIGQGAVPGIILETTLKSKGLAYEVSDSLVEGKVAIQYLTDGPSVMQSLMKDKKAGVESYGLLGEPAVTTAVSKGLIENFDLQKEYQNATSSAVAGYAQAVLVARKDIADNKDLIEAVLAAFERNDTKLVEDSKAVVDGIKSKFSNSTLDSSKMTKEVIARCGIKTLRASSNPGIIETTLMKFEAINKKAIGDKLPDGAFYYAA